MARIRTIKPETFTSESIAALSLAARWTFVGLWTYADDEGRAKDNPKIIRGAIWPNNEDTISSRDVETHLVELEHSAMVCRYTDDEGAHYLHVINFKKHQVVNRPSKSRIPPCPLHDFPQPPKAKEPKAQSETREGSNTSHAQLSESSSKKSEASNAPKNGVLKPSRDAADVFETPPVDNFESPGQTPSSIPHGNLTEPSVPELGTRNRELGTGNREDDFVVSSATASPRTDPAPVRLDVERICTHLADRIEGNGSKRPPIKQSWRNAARLMLDRDERTEANVHAAIDWCQDSEFWRGNILSLPKLREKYDQLRLQAQRQMRQSGTATNGMTTGQQRLADAADIADEMRRLDEAEATHQPPILFALPPGRTA